MTRLDQLAQPTRRKGEHIRAVIERERKQHIEESLAAEKATKTRKMSRSLTHLSSGSSIRSPAPLRYSLYQSGRNSSTPYSAKSSILSRPLRKPNATKSMTQLVTAKLLCTSKSPAVIEARKAQTKNDNGIEIDSRTTNVSVAGVCLLFISDSSSSVFNSVQFLDRLIESLIDLTTLYEFFTISNLHINVDLHINQANQLHFKLRAQIYKHTHLR